MTFDIFDKIEQKQTVFLAVVFIYFYFFCKTSIDVVNLINGLRNLYTFVHENKTRTEF